MRLRIQSQCHLQKTSEDLKNENARIETQLRNRRKRKFENRCTVTRARKKQRFL